MKQINKPSSRFGGGKELGFLSFSFAGAADGFAGAAALGVVNFPDLSFPFFWNIKNKIKNDEIFTSRSMRNNIADSVLITQLYCTIKQTKSTILTTIKPHDVFDLGGRKNLFWYYSVLNIPLALCQNISPKTDY